jgi:hypothetical protein
MKQAALHMSNAWNIIKKSKDPVWIQEFNQYP